MPDGTTYIVQGTPDKALNRPADDPSDVLFQNNGQAIEVNNSLYFVLSGHNRAAAVQASNCRTDGIVPGFKGILFRSGQITCFVSNHNRKHIQTTRIQIVQNRLMSCLEAGIAISFAFKYLCSLDDEDAVRLKMSIALSGKTLS